MTEGKLLSFVGAVAVLLLTITSYKDGASAAQVDVSPRDPMVKVGQNFTFLCRIGKPLMYCRLEVPGISGALNLNENSKKTPGYWYEGNGLKSGQCGISLARLTDANNGQIRCTMGLVGEDSEAVGYTNITVARPPSSRPDLVVTPDPEPRLGAYTEDTTIKAKCSVRDARPVATILWFIGDDQISDGLGQREIVDMANDLHTVHQNLTRKLSWRDNGKDLRCVAKHYALETDSSYTIKQINVRFPPRPKDARIEQFGFQIGSEGIINLQIQANPKPSLSWTVGGESIAEGQLDSTQRFEASVARGLGNGTWEANLRIIRVLAEDVDKQYTLRANNGLGVQNYRVFISTSPEPQGSLELGTGPIIGIVVAVLVLLIVVFMLIFARATGRWCFSGGATARHDNKESETFLKDSQTQGSNPNTGDNAPDEQKSLTASAKVNESSDTESADHGPSEKSKKPKMNLTYILKKKKDKVAADEEDLKFQNVAMEPEKELEKPGTESSEHIATPVKGKAAGQDVVYAELDLQAIRRPVVRREDEKTEYAEIIHAKPGGEEESGTQ